MLKILTWLWRQPGGRTTYTAGHVNIWAAMVSRHLSMPHRLACVTDMPEGLRDDIEIIAPPGDFVGVETDMWCGALPNCFRRLAMFRRDAAAIFGERFVCMDTDCVISGPLDPLFDRANDLVLYRGTNARRPYNGSMMMMTAGCRPQVFESFTPERANAVCRRYLGSDQSWISAALGAGEKTWGPEDGVAWWGSQSNRDLRIMFFPGSPKPWDLVGMSGWIDTHYRGDEGGRCIVLGSSAGVWEAAAEAMEQRFDAVLAYPETAKVWPGPIREIVADRRHAEAVARMHGFSEVAFCGMEG